jgi:hypothetical protein
VSILPGNVVMLVHSTVTFDRNYLEDWIADVPKIVRSGRVTVVDFVRGHCDQHCLALLDFLFGAHVVMLPQHSLERLVRVRLQRPKVAVRTVHRCPILPIDRLQRKRTNHGQQRRQRRIVLERVHEHRSIRETSPQTLAHTTAQDALLLNEFDHTALLSTHHLDPENRAGTQIRQHQTLDRGRYTFHCQSFSERHLDIVSSFFFGRHQLLP